MRDDVGFGGGYCFAGGGEEGVLDCDFLVGGVFVVYLYFAIVDIDAPMFDVDGVSLGEPYVAVYTTTAVPTGVGLVGVVYTYCHNILAFMNIGSDVVFETAIAVWPKPNLLTIDINCRVHINPIEFQEKQLFLLTSYI